MKLDFVQRTTLVALSWLVGSSPAATAQAETKPPRPNIVVILADDLGYGDLSCYGATKVKTPNLHRLATQGLRFTDAHCTSGTCTPSRYSLLTGRYAWRKKGTGILPGDASLIIEPGSRTLPAMLQQAGYSTGAVGKWHLGLGRGKIDWNAEIAPGPLEVGFDSSFIIPATGDRVPCVYIENHRVFSLDPSDPVLVDYGMKVGDEPTGREHPEMLKIKLSVGHDGTIVNGISRIGFMAGGKIARWKDEDIAETLTRRAVTFIEEHQRKPFFLYFATHDIHVPRAPHARFAGTSQCGVRGDVIQELDWSVGEVLAALDRLHLADNTLVIFSSDNGPIVDDGYADGAQRDLNGHLPAGPLRGSKYSVYEGGTRMPLLIRWPGKIKSGTSAALVCQIDLLASLAHLVEAKPPEGGAGAPAASDSQDLLAEFLGQSATGRPSLIEQGGGLAIRQGNWKLIPRGQRSGPNGALKANFPQRIELEAELYDLADDPAELHNVAAAHPDTVRDMTALFEQIRGNDAR